MIAYDPLPPFDCGHVSEADGKTRRGALAELAKAGASPREALAVPKLLMTRFRQLLTRA
ncbi:MAG: hypothetical protein KUG77_17055 [Nannocystaceae bacterium]|nr:hypothetical protein [Nannocystaceae bacterium]